MFNKEDIITIYIYWMIAETGIDVIVHSWCMCCTFPFYLCTAKIIKQFVSSKSNLNVYKFKKKKKRTFYTRIYPDGMNMIYKLYYIYITIIILYVIIWIFFLYMYIIFIHGILA